MKLMALHSSDTDTLLLINLDYFVAAEKLKVKHRNEKTFQYEEVDRSRVATVKGSYNVKESPEEIAEIIKEIISKN